MTTVAMPSVHYVVILPEIIFTVAAVGLLVASSLVRGRLRSSVGTAVTVIASVAVVVDCVAQWVDVSRHGPSTTMAHVIIEDGFSVVAILILAVSLGLSALIADGWLNRERIEGVELHGLSLASVAGAVMMAQANDLVVIFLGLEIMSIGLYVLAAFDRR